LGLLGAQRLLREQEENGEGPFCSLDRPVLQDTLKPSLASF